MKVLAIDLGTKRTGFAVSDPAGTMALALPTLLDVTAVDAAQVVEEQQAEAVVVGLPLNMSGTAGPAAERTMEFVEELRLLVDVPVDVWDERLSTAEGQTRLREQGLNRKERTRRADVAAAIVILESWLRRKQR